MLEEIAILMIDEIDVITPAEFDPNITAVMNRLGKIEQIPNKLFWNIDEAALMSTIVTIVTMKNVTTCSLVSIAANTMVTTRSNIITNLPTVIRIGEAMLLLVMMTLIAEKETLGIIEQTVT